MKLTSLYNKYFQKSKVFLFPLTGLRKKDDFNPSFCGLSLDGIYTFSDLKLIVVYDIPSNPKQFYTFLNKKVKKSTIYETHFLNNDKTKEIVIFDLKIYKKELVHFYNGQYSKLSKHVKKSIMNYYGYDTTAWILIESYLNPESYFEDYAVLLGVSVRDIKTVGQLCDEPNLEKETIKLELNDETNVSLQER